MGAVTFLRQLFLQTVGGVAPTDASNASGSIAAMVKFLITNGPTSFAKLSNASLSSGNKAFMATPGVGLMLDRDAAAVAFGVQGAPIVTAITATWDATNRIVLGANTNLGLSQFSVSNSAPVITGVGGGGRFPAFANAAAVLVPGSTYTKFVIEFYGKWATASAARSDNRYWGLSSSGRTLNAATQGYGFYRKTTSGWTVISSDGTVSETSEASDTSDGNMHIFRLEWDGTANVLLYVDGVLKVTKTTNPPLESGAYSLSNFGAYAASADASNLWYIGAILAYFA